MSRLFYSLLIYLALPFTPFKLLWRSLRQPEYRAHWAERYGFFTQTSKQPVIWLHCVSVGETRAAEPLIKALLEQYPQYQILISHATPTGRATSEQLFGDKILRCYLPYDTTCLSKRFLKHFNPQLGVLMETELWFNLIASCHQQEIPLLLLNARLSEKSAKGYARFEQLMQQGLHQLKAIAAQTALDADRFKSFGAINTSVMGNLKFDVRPPSDTAERGIYLRNMLGKDRPVFLAASTRSLGSENEESIILDAIKNTQIPNLLTIIVPRHPQRFDEVANYLSQNGISFCRRSEFTMGNVAAEIPNCDVILGDSMGEMFTYYAACDVAFIGGSLLPLGGQNLLEAFAVGKPAIIGQHTYNFADTSESALKMGAAVQVNNASDLTDALNDLLTEGEQLKQMGQKGLKFIEGSRGATEESIRLIKQHLPTKV